MYKVVIVDDEEIIANGLKMILPWEKHGCEVVGIAYNGEEGLQVIREKRPDILFTDIRMPGMDGLSMVAALKSEFPRTQITVLTGFRDFEYAQTAIKLGVSRFLLKPSKMDELHEALAAMVQTLDSLPPAPPVPAVADPEDEIAVAEAVKQEIDLDDEAQDHSYVIEKALKYIQGHCTSKLTLAEVAENTYVSQWHLSKLLKRYTNNTFYDLLNTARVEAAKELLKDPNAKVGDIALQVGFSDTAHFAKNFKKFAGCSANEFRSSQIE